MFRGGTTCAMLGAVRGVALLGGLLVAAAAHAQFTVELRDGLNGYAGTRDVMLQDGSGPYGNPAASYDGADDSIDGFPFPRVTVMRFDVGALPPGSPVSAAQLSFGIGNTSSDTFPIYELLRPWSAATASWTQPQAGMTWSSPGAAGAGVDRGLLVLGTASATPPYVFTPAGIGAVQRWVDQPMTNFGFAIQNFVSSDALNVRHCDFVTVGSRPQLTVTLADAGTTVFRQGASPTAGYLGCSDTTLVGAPPLDGNANGWGLVISGGSPLASSLVSFDLSVLPADATVTAVQLQLRGTDGSSSIFSIYEALRPWGELTATWTTYDGTLQWVTPGANGAGTDRGSVSLGGGNIVTGANAYPLNAQGVQLVQDWIRGVRPNRGLSLINLAAANRGAWADREAVDPVDRPSLRVTLTSPTWDGGLIFPADAGPDAGADAAVDAGLDGGAGADAGVDAGVPDAGPDDLGPPKDYRAGCGCSSAGEAWMLVALLALARELRARRKR